MATTINLMRHNAPGLNPQRLVNLMRQAIDRCQLDLTDYVILTEAATGAYVVTPVLAAMAGAQQVFAVTKSTSYGSVEEVTDETMRLALAAGVDDKILISSEKSSETLAQADIITNSGHVRPINANMIERIKPTAVIPLMYEAWEFRNGDIDLDECRRKGIKVAGTNERHPSVDVFSFLGIMAVKLLLDAGVSVWSSRILVLCDNPFAPFISRGLEGAGAEVHLTRGLGSDTDNRKITGRYDAVVVALKPRLVPIVGAARSAVISASEIKARCPGAVVAQFWGDLDRAELQRQGVAYWPMTPVPRGQMGILPSGVGPEPVVRLQCGGLKVGEVLCRGVGDATDADLAFLEIM